MRDGGHGGRLDERRGMRDGAGNEHDARLPGRVGACGRGVAAGRGRLVCEFKDGTQVASMIFLFRWPPGVPVFVLRSFELGAGVSPKRSRSGATGAVAQAALVARRAGAPAMTAWRSPRRSPPGQRDRSRRSLVRRPVDHGETGVERGPAPRVGAPLDRHREDDARGRLKG